MAEAIAPSAAPLELPTQPTTPPTSASARVREKEQARQLLERQLAVMDIGSAFTRCALVQPGLSRPVVLAAESVPSFGIRDGEIVDLERASETLRIAAEALSRRAGRDIRRFVFGFGGDVRHSVSKGAMPLTFIQRPVTPQNIARLRAGLYPEGGPRRRVIHRFDGPYSVGDVHGVERPVGLYGPTLAMQSSFLTVPTVFLENLKQAAWRAGLEAEALIVQPFAASLGSLTPDERALGAAVLDLGAGGFRGALWEGGRLKQLISGYPERTNLPQGVTPAPNGLEGILLNLARRFRVSPETARRLCKECGANRAFDSSTELPICEPQTATAHTSGETLELPRPGRPRRGSTTSIRRIHSHAPRTVEVAAVDGFGRVEVNLDEWLGALEELLTPEIRQLRDGLPQFTAGHAAGVVLAGEGARLPGLSELVSRHFGGASVRIGAPHWQALMDTSHDEGAFKPGGVGGHYTVADHALEGPGWCGLCGLAVHGLERRALQPDTSSRWWGKGRELGRDCWNWLRRKLA